MHPRRAILLLNVAHAVDHMALLIFAAAVARIASDFGFARWEDLMPFGVGAFVMFGLGSLPAGRLGDLWGRRAMMVVFFFGIGVSLLLAALAQGPWQLAVALTLVTPDLSATLLPSCTPSSGGQRLCTGVDLAVVEVAAAPWPRIGEGQPVWRATPGRAIELVVGAGEAWLVGDDGRWLGDDRPV